MQELQQGSVGSVGQTPQHADIPCYQALCHVVFVCHAVPYRAVLVVQVEAGCVTPLAVANPSAKHVLLLIDSKLQEAGSPFFVHPIVNSASVLISTAGLDAFLRCGVGSIHLEGVCGRLWRAWGGAWCEISKTVHGVWGWTA